MFQPYQQVKRKFKLLKDADEVGRFVVSKYFLKAVGTSHRNSGASQFLKFCLKKVKMQTCLILTLHRISMSSIQ